MEQRLSLITLAVRDVAASRAFYERLGWVASQVGGGEVAFFQTGGVIFAVYGRDDLSRDIGIPLPAHGSAMSIAHNLRTQAEVDIALAEAERAGAKVLKPGHRTPWGGYVAYFADPDGHVWELAWNPAFPIAADGSIRLPE